MKKLVHQDSIILTQLEPIHYKSKPIAKKLVQLACTAQCLPRSARQLNKKKFGDGSFIQRVGYK
jgi:hypothetical protein